MIFLFLPLVLGIAALAVFALVGRWFVAADPSRLAARLRSASGLMLVAVGAFLLLRGQIFLGISLIGAGLARLGHAPGPLGGGGFGGPRSRRARPRAGQASTVRTARLEATLDHDTGEMDAEVLAGRFEGRRFSQMSDEEVLDVWRDCGGDEESRLLVEAYLDRRRPDWRDDVEGDPHPGAGGARGPGGGGSGAMTEQDAYEVLGLQPGASEAEIRAAHRRLMKQMHPDHGGSTFFAAKLNEAKDVLLRRRR